MPKSITCPECRSHGEARDADRFEVRGVHQGHPVRKCTHCGSGLYVKVIGKAQLIEENTWMRMEEMWDERFNKNATPIADAAVAFEPAAAPPPLAPERVQTGLSSLSIEMDDENLRKALLPLDVFQCSFSPEMLASDSTDLAAAGQGFAEIAKYPGLTLEAQGHILNFAADLFGAASAAAGYQEAIGRAGLGAVTVARELNASAESSSAMGAIFNATVDFATSVKRNR